MKLGAESNRYGQPVLFAEIVSLVMENYVDPVAPDKLMRGAYEGLLAGLDANGAYLTPEEVREWRRDSPQKAADGGFAVLKGGRVFQIVSVEPGSPSKRSAKGDWASRSASTSAKV